MIVVTVVVVDVLVFVADVSVVDVVELDVVVVLHEFVVLVVEDIGCALLAFDIEEIDLLDLI